MILHSMDIPNKKAIIEHMGNLIEVEYYISELGNLWLTNESCAICDNDGISLVEVRNMLYRHIVNAPKLKKHWMADNELQDQPEQAEREAVDDNIENPSHYQILPSIEVIHVRRALLDKIPADVSCNAIDEWSRAWEYLTRMWGKNGLEDAKKARVYLNWLIERMEGER